MSLDKNPFINRPQHRYGAVPFDVIKLEHFIPALDYAIHQAEEKLQEVKNNSETPSFDNTALPMETCLPVIFSIFSTTKFLTLSKSLNWL